MLLVGNSDNSLVDVLQIERQRAAANSHGISLDVFFNIKENN